MMSQSRTILGIEELESRLALSSYNPALVATAAPSAEYQAAAPPSQPSQHLHGPLQGSYTIVPSIPDTGRQYDLSGSGNIHGLGQVTATGELRSTGFVYNGQATGTLTLQNANGTVTLQLVGPSQPAGLRNGFLFALWNAPASHFLSLESCRLVLLISSSRQRPLRTWPFPSSHDTFTSVSAPGAYSEVVHACS
jgi:hypothetical protein